MFTDLPQEEFVATVEMLSIKLTIADYQRSNPRASELEAFAYAQQHWRDQDRLAECFLLMARLQALREADQACPWN